MRMAAGVGGGGAGAGGAKVGDSRRSVRGVAAGAGGGRLAGVDMAGLWIGIGTDATMTPPMPSDLRGLERKRSCYQLSVPQLIASIFLFFSFLFSFTSTYAHALQREKKISHSPNRISINSS